MGKRFILKLLLAAFLLQSLQVQGSPLDPQTVFNTANNLYFRNQFDSSSALYQGLIDSGYRNAKLFFNAANAYLKGSRIGDAVYYYNEALRLTPGNPEIQHNLHLANLRIANDPEGLPTLWLVTALETYVSWNTPAGWSWGLLALTWLMGAALFLIWKGSGKFRFIRRLLWVFGFLWIFFLSGVLGTRYVDNRHDEGIIMRDQASLRSAPDPNSPELLDMHPGWKVRILDEAAGWQKVRLADGREGWVAASVLQVL